ncbi:MAG: MBL fold metallo-hydrolase [Candidatus Omnitrophota bacterium]|nr:MAG: MBL fold metallo-hydrolase [Candidatus Omnitrophota bacterium]
MSIVLKFCGGVREVSGSNHLLITNKSKVLLDAGLFQGRRKDYYKINSKFAYKPFEIDALVLSHAHIDHSGNIPSLIKRGFRGKIYTTAASKALARLMLLDSGKIQEDDAKFVNKLHKRKNWPAVKPLYTKKDAEFCLRFFYSAGLHKKIKITKDVQLSFFDAGHILGSALSCLEVKNNARTIRIGYIVDLGRKNLPLLNNPEYISNLDYLIIESTYGNRLHQPIIEAKANLARVIMQTIANSGKVIIPSFAMERAQEVLCFLSQLLKEKKMMDVPIYLDSPLAIDITDVFKKYVSFLDSATQYLFNKYDGPFPVKNMTYIRKVKDSKMLNSDPRPMIIIAGSGMCESGRILHHLKNTIEDKKNTIIVVGYMAQNTLGKRLVEHSADVRIYGEEYKLNANVVVNNAFSAHADRNALISYVMNCKNSNLKKVFVVHGDVEQGTELVKHLQQRGVNAYLPEKNEELVL